MFNNIISSVKRFFKIGNAIDKSLQDEAQSKDKCLYVSEQNVAKLQDAVVKLDDLKQEQKETLDKIKSLDTTLQKIAADIAVEAQKEGVSIPHNFSNWASLIQKGLAIIAAASIGGVLLSEVLMALMDSYKAAEKDKAFNEKLYERLIQEEYEERQYIIGLLEDKKKQAEIEASQSVLNLPVVTQMIAPPPSPPVYSSPMVPPPAPAPVPKPQPTPPPPPPKEEPVEEVVEEIATDPAIDEPVIEEEPSVSEPEEKLSHQFPVLMDNDKNKVEDISTTDLEPPPPPSIYGPPPKMDFSRNYSIFSSSVTTKALKALGLEKPLAILGGTVVTTIIIHHVEAALNEIHDLVVKRLANTGEKEA